MGFNEQFIWLNYSNLAEIRPFGDEFRNPHHYSGVTEVIMIQPGGC